MGEQLKVGDLVWAKMKGFSPWPGKVIPPVGDMKRPKSSKALYCIHFFGPENHAWIEVDKIKPYVEFKESLEKTCKTVQFKEACAAIADFKKRRDAGEFEEFYSEDGFILDAPNSSELFESSSSSNRSKRGSKSPPSLTPKRDGFKSPTTVKSPAADSTIPGDTDAAPRLSSSNSTTLKVAPKRKKAVAVENGEAPSTSTTPVPSTKKRKGSSEPKVSKVKSSPKKPATAKVVNNVNPVVRKSAASSFINRPILNCTPPNAEPLNVLTVSQTLKDKKITPSTLRFGFLGLGIMGAGMVKNLLNSGHQVMVWNRSPDKCKQFVEAGGEQGMTPSDVIGASDITFSCVSDPNAVKEMIFGNCGVLHEMDATKGYVEMTTIDPESSKDVEEAIASKGGRYLEAQVQGSKSEVEEGTLIILAAGERSLYEECQSTFQAMGRHSYYLGEVGNASKMNLVLQLMAGSSLATLAEGMALADRAGLQQRDVLEILGLTSLSCPLFMEKGQTIIDGGFPTKQPLQHMQKDLNLVLNLGHQLEQPLSMAANANEIYKHAKRLGYGEHDAAAVYIRARF